MRHATLLLVPMLMTQAACLINTDLYEQRRAELLGMDSGAGEADGGGSGAEDSGQPEEDLDGDGFTVTDCDDTNGAIHPGAVEGWLDDGIDNDCDQDLHDPVEWSAATAATRLLGAASGDEFGRRIAWWSEGDCLLVASNFAAEAAGRVYGFPAGEAGSLAAVNAGHVEGPASYVYLGNDVAVDMGGRLLLTAPAAGDGRGVAWISDASIPCGGTQESVAAAPSMTIQGDAAEGWLGTWGDWLPDLDGDGVQDLAIAASGAPGGGTGRGELYFFLSPAHAGSLQLASDADIIVQGERDGSALAEAHAAVVREGDGLPRLVFVEKGHPEGGRAIVLTDASALRSGSVVDLARGSVVSFSSDPAHVEVVGDLSRDGTDEIVGGVWTWGLWDLALLDGTFEESTASLAFGFDQEGEWLTGIAALGDLDQDGLGDLAVLAEDWPLGTEQGRLGLLSGADLPSGDQLDLTALRLQASGAQVGDSFGYRVIPVGDFDRDGRVDLAVSAYGADPSGPSAGSVVLLPSPY